jgi:hypothetical protein
MAASGTSVAAAAKHPDIVNEILFHPAQRYSLKFWEPVNLIYPAKDNGNE